MNRSSIRISYPFLAEYQNSYAHSARSPSYGRNSFVREELHRPFTPPSTRVSSHTEEQQATISLLGEPNDLPSNLAQSIFQRENRPARRELLTYPPGSTAAGKFSFARGIVITKIDLRVLRLDYDHDISAVADEDDDDDDDDDQDDDDDDGDHESNQPMNLTRIESSTDRTISDSPEDYWASFQNQTVLPMNDKQLCTLKQRLLAYLYQRAKQTNKQLRFIHSFNDYLASKFYKVQFLTNHVILLKFAHETIVNKRQQEQQMHYALFVVYDIRTSTILNIYEDSSAELAEIFEKYNDDIRHSSSYGLISYDNLEFFPLSTYAGRRQFEHNYSHSTSSNEGESIKRLLMQLPLRTITHTISPYLDLNLYSYDDKIVHIDDMIKTCPNNPVRFFSRDCQRMKFQLTLTNRSIILSQLNTTDNPGTTTTIVTPNIIQTTSNAATTTNTSTTAANNALFISNTLSTNRRTTLATLWHPIEPFCITIQRWPRDHDNIHNFHLYRPPNLRWKNSILLSVRVLLLPSALSSSLVPVLSYICMYTKNNSLFSFFLLLSLLFSLVVRRILKDSRIFLRSFLFALIEYFHIKNMLYIMRFISDVEYRLDRFSCFIRWLLIRHRRRHNLPPLVSPATPLVSVHRQHWVFICFIKPSKPKPRHIA